MRGRAAASFPLVVAAALPLAGVVLAGVQYQQGDRDYAARLAIAAVLGVVIWTLLLTL